MESKTQDDIIRSEKVEEREKEGSEQADTNRAEYGCLSKKRAVYGNFDVWLSPSLRTTSKVPKTVRTFESI